MNSKMNCVIIGDAENHFPFLKQNQLWNEGKRNGALSHQGDHDRNAGLCHLRFC